MIDISEHIYHHLMDTYMNCKEHVSLQSSSAAKWKEYFRIKKVYYTDSKIAI